MSPVESAWAQLFSVGIVWISVHCAGMCGPILMGFDVAGVHRGAGVGRGAAGVLTYQLGRALVYAIFGALVGLFGAGLERHVHLAGGWMSVAFGLALVLGVVERLLRQRRGDAGLDDALSRHLRDLARPVLRAAAGSPALTNLTLGLMMGLLPCMISIWALSLAALTASPFHGAALMVALVAMTTPMLLGVTLLPRFFTGRLRALGHRAPALLMGLSGVWLTLAGSAGLGWIHHAHFGFEAFGRSFAVMFW